MNNHDLDRLERLAALKSQGIISDEELEQEKAKIKRQSAEIQPRPKPAPNKTKLGKPLWLPKKNVSTKRLFMYGLLFVCFMAVVASYVFDTPTSRGSSEPAPIFSAYDGSSYAVEARIKEEMNDPDSYQHVKTVVTPVSDGYMVFCKFRGKNNFNATITQSVNAKLDKKGNIIRWGIMD